MLSEIAKRFRLDKFLLIPVSIVLVTGCGRGGGGGGTPPTPASDPALSASQFVDSAVFGMEYVSGKLSGVTDTLGTFQYESDSDITFSIGGITLGTVTPAGKTWVTPLEMIIGAQDETDPAVTNILRFLQTIDDNHNHADGISISDAVRTQASGMTVNFNQGVTAFEQDANVQSVIASLTAVTQAGVQSLIPAATALDNFRQSMQTRIIGSYCSSYMGTDDGTLDYAVDYQGNIQGSGNSTALGAFTVSGTVDSQGVVNMTQSIAGIPAATFSGSIDADRNLSGTWTDNNGSSGTVSGERSAISCEQKRASGLATMAGATRITFDVYNGHFIDEYKSVGAPADILRPYDSTVTYSGNNMRAEHVLEEWGPVPPITFPPVYGRVTSEYFWVSNASGDYVYDWIKQEYEKLDPVNDIYLIYGLLSEFNKVRVSALGDTIMFQDGTVTGKKTGTMVFDGKTCSLYDVSASIGSLGQVCLTTFANVSDAVILYYKTTGTYDDGSGNVKTFDYIVMARDIEEGIAVNSDTFAVP
jgi:hypothetical protein